MLYLSGHVRCEMLSEPQLGWMLSPKMGNRLPSRGRWAADSGTWALGKRWEFDLDEYLEWLDRRTPDERARCMFAVCPDVVGDGDETLANQSVLADIKMLAYPTAYVVQPGCDFDTLPWSLIDVVFLGGPDEHQEAELTRVARVAHEHGKWAHRGRINSLKRWKATRAAGFDSCDGTYLAFGFEKNWPRAQRWFQWQRDEEAREQAQLAMRLS